MMREREMRNKNQIFFYLWDKNKHEEEKVFWNREKEKRSQMNKEFFSHSVVDFGVKGV